MLDGDRIKELHNPIGGDLGETYLDDKFFKILEECFGKDEFEKFKREDPNGFIELRGDFEFKAHNTFITTNSKISITLPHHLKNKCDISRSKFAERLVCKDEKLEFDGWLIKEWHSEVMNTIKDNLIELLEKHNIDKIAMVGGFGESPHLQSAMREAFPNQRIIVINKARLAVLKGAVLYGHNPSSIFSRVAKFTYGIGNYIPIEDGKTVLDKNRIKTFNGERYETDVFSKHVTKGENLDPNKPQAEETFLPLRQNQKNIRFCVLKSSIENPKYVDDPECRPLGYINVDIPDTSEGLDREVRVRFNYGGTEIKTESVNERTGDVIRVMIEYSDSV